MKKYTAAILLAASTVGAHSAPDEHYVIMGVADLLYAQEVCRFDIKADAVTSYLRARDVLTPEAMAEITVRLNLNRHLQTEVSHAECEIQKGIARSIGALSE